MSEIKGKRLESALAHLDSADRDLARILAEVGPPPPRSRPPGFSALLQIIMNQQLSVASARAIWARLSAAANPLTPAAILRLELEALRALGLSRQKAVYVRDLAAAVEEGRLDVDALARLPDEAVIAALTRVRGLGRWSGEVYLLFSLGRPDVLPADDLALLVAAQRLKGLPARPRPAELRAMAEPWRPWRSVACRLLWHYYHHLVGRAGI
jgi:DNA-3-methyladenine glycosylase II